MIQHRTLPRQKLSGAGGVPVEDWGAGAMRLPRGLWVERSHGRSVTHKRGSAHSLCRVGRAIAVVVGNLFGAALGLGVECDFCLALATGYLLGTLMVLLCCLI